MFLISRIGYGNITPETVVGRWALILYAIFGMPLALTMYSVAGKMLVQLITYVLDMIQTRVYKKPNEEVKNLQLKTLALSIVLFVLIILTGCFVTSSSSMENLDFSSSFYFWFISLSTIGYGDITFKRKRHLMSPHLMCVAVLNLLFGIGILAAIIAAISLVLEKRDLNMSAIIIDNDEEGLLSDDDEDDNDDIFEDETHSTGEHNDRFLPHDVLEKMREQQKQQKGNDTHFNHEQKHDAFNYVDVDDDDEQTCITNLSSEESLNNERPNLRNSNGRYNLDSNGRSSSNSNDRLILDSNDRSISRLSSCSMLSMTPQIIVTQRFKEDTLSMLKKRLATREHLKNQPSTPPPYKGKANIVSDKCKINPAFDCEYLKTTTM